MRFRPVVARLGLKNGLKACYDTSDIRSLPGGGTQLLDAFSSGPTFNYGNGSTSSTFPALSGSAGTLGARLGFDGGDYLRLAVSNPAWINNLHKDNVKLTIAAWVYVDTLGSVQGIFGTRGAASGNTGFVFLLSTSGFLQLAVQNAGSSVLSQTSAGAAQVVEDAWNFVAVSLDESVGTGGISWLVNGNTDTDPSTYSSPSTGNASFAAEIGAFGNAVAPLLATNRVAGLLAWEGVSLTPGQMQKFYHATRRRFGV